MKVLFFGSTADSVIVLDKIKEYSVDAVVTQPPRPVGRKQVITPTPVEVWAKEHKMLVLSFGTNKEKPWLYEDEEQVIDALQPLKADLIISACYGQKIPTATIKAAKWGGLNVHPSLLPRWRGGDPVPWTILYGDRQTGVTVVRVSDKFDAGEIVTQKKINLRGDELPDQLRTKLFEMGAKMLAKTIPDVQSYTTPDVVQIGHIGSERHEPYARRLTRQDGFVPWEFIRLAMNLEFQGDSSPRSERLGMISGDNFAGLRGAGNVTIVQEMLKRKEVSRSDLATWIDRMVRAFSPWPGVWTEIDMSSVKYQVSSKKRVKILSVHLTHDTCNLILDIVQLEGKKPMAFTKFSKQIEL